MKRLFCYVFLILTLFVLFSCSSTSAFVSPVTTSSSLSIEEKLEYWGGKELFLDQCDMFFDGEVWLERLEEEVENSQDYILMSVFLGSSSERLENLFATMERKAKEGVRIYLIVDGSSNMDMTDTKFVMTPLNYLRDSGINVVIYDPLTFTHLMNPSRLLVRDHRKLMVFDGKTAAIGGMNLNYISIGAGENNQRDSMYLFHSPSLSKILVEEFVSTWNGISVEEISTFDFKTYEGNGEYRAWLFNDDVFKSEASIPGMYGSLMEEATYSVFLCPYLPCPDSNMKESIKRAVDRGVEFEIWCSEDSRSYLKSGFAWSMADLLSTTNAKYYDVTKREDGSTYPLFHMKMMVVDDRWLVIGSSNYNFRSMALSHEMVLVIDSPFLAKEAKEKAKISGGNPVLVSEEEYMAKKKEYGTWLGYLMIFFGG